jgi:OHCU decarboxylase
VTEAGLWRLNALGADEAFVHFLSCGGSSKWANRMAGARPFENLLHLFAVSDSAWQDLETADWLEAFRSHPRIGERASGSGSRAGHPAWAAEEQAGAQSAAGSVRAALDEANHRYEEKFGHIFIVCATGKTADEMLTALDARLPNDPAIELAIAAGEQRKIANLRLEKLLRSLDAATS